MIKLAKFAALALVAFALNACADQDNRKISHEKSSLGHEYVLMPILEEGVTDITVAMAWPTDWLFTDGGNEWAPGLASTVILEGGTDTHSPAEIKDLLGDKNTRGNVYTTTDMVYAEVEYPNNHRNAVVPVLADMIQRPNFDPKWFERFQARALENRRNAKQPVHSQMWEAARFALFGDSAQAAYLNGHDLEHLSNLSLDELKDWHRVSLSKQPVAIVVVGATNATDAGSAIDELLPPPSKERHAELAVQEMQFGHKIIYLHLPDAVKSTLGFMGPLPATRDGQDHIDLIATRIFSGGPGSPLFEAVRTKLGASYDMSATITNFSRSQRVLIIAGEVDTAKISDVRNGVRDAYKQFVQHPDLAGLSDIKTRVADGVRKNLIYVDSSATMIRELVLDGHDPQDYHGYAERYDNLSETEIRDRLKEAFPLPGTLSVFAAGPDPSAFPDACVISQTAEAANCWRP